MNLTPQQQALNMIKGIEALETNPKKCIGKMECQDGGKSALFVFCVVAETVNTDPDLNLNHGKYFPDSRLADFFGVPKRYLELLRDMNDGINGFHELNHQQIAQIIRLQIFVPMLEALGITEEELKATETP